MEAYDTAVLSYALATASGKFKPNFLGITSNLNTLPIINPTVPRIDDVSLTPPRLDSALQDVQKNHFYQMLSTLEQALQKKVTIPMHQLVALCTNVKQVFLMSVLHVVLCLFLSHLTN